MTIESLPIAGIALAAAGATILAFGNQFQDDGVTSVSKGGELGAGQLTGLLRSKTWLFGTLLLGVAILFQLASLTVAQLIVVQPVGVLALVAATLITAFRLKKRPSIPTVRAIVLCVVGVGVFVTVASLVAKQTAITEAKLIAILIVLSVVLAIILVAHLTLRRRGMPPIFSVIAGGVLSGFVVTLGKTVILRVQTALAGGFAIDEANVLTGGCVLAILVAGGLSIYFVQTAHATSSPEVVVAGLTVIDPFVAVILGITVLGEAAGAPLWAVAIFVVAGAVAVFGVFALSRAQASNTA